MGNGRLPSGSTGRRQWRDTPNRLVKVAGDPPTPPPQNPHVFKDVKDVVHTHVHVHPDAIFPADVRDGDEGVEGSVHRRPSGGAHEEWNKTLRSGVER